jgi:hypothetical protein
MVWVVSNTSSAPLVAVGTSKVEVESKLIDLAAADGKETRNAAPIMVKFTALTIVSVMKSAR